MITHGPANATPNPEITAKSTPKAGQIALRAGRSGGSTGRRQTEGKTWYGGKPPTIEGFGKIGGRRIVLVGRVRQARSQSLNLWCDAGRRAGQERQGHAADHLIGVVLGHPIQDIVERASRAFGQQVDGHQSNRPIGMREVLRHGTRQFLVERHREHIGHRTDPHRPVAVRGAQQQSGRAGEREAELPRQRIGILEGVEDALLPHELLLFQHPREPPGRLDLLGLGPRGKNAEPAAHRIGRDGHRRT